MPKSFAPTYFSYKKSRQKNFPQNYNTLLWRKFLRFQRTFYKKSFVSGFGAEAPTDNAHKKTRISPRFLFFHQHLELRSKPCFKVLFVKSPLKIRKNFSTNISIFREKRIKFVAEYSIYFYCFKFAFYK